MRRQPDNEPVIDDDSGSYDVRELRGRRVDPELVSAIEKAVQRLRPEVHYEGGSKRLLTWLLGLISALLAAFIVGSVIGYGTLQALRAESVARWEDMSRRLDRLENRLDGRSGTYRGGANDSNAR